MRGAVEALRPRLEGHLPKVAVVLGSGLDALSRDVQAPMTIPFSEVPGLPRPLAAGHQGAFVAGTLSGVPVLIQSGRFHLYEGHPPHLMALPVRLFRALGVGTLILTNASGGLRRGLIPGSLMVITDHLNLTFRNPLHGPAPPGETRFPDMSEPYDSRLRTLARDVARTRGIRLEAGVYAGLIGPSYETPSEILMLERLGADVVGMSTVAEVIAARACGLPCLGISLVTNLAAGRTGAPLLHEEVLRAASRATGELTSLVEGIIEAVGNEV